MELNKQQVEIDKKYEQLEILIFNVFTSDEGAELLAKWKEALIMTPIAQAGMDSIGIGIEQGKRDFIRSILLTIKKRQNA